MEVSEAEFLVRKHAAELAEREHTAQEAAREALALRKIIAGYIDMFSELQNVIDADVATFLPAADDTSPKGAEAVRLILHKSPNEVFYVSDLVTELRGRGWLPESDNPANAVRTALERLVSTPEADVEKIRYTSGKVGYQYAPDRDREPYEGPPAYDEEPF